MILKIFSSSILLLDKIIFHLILLLIIIRPKNKIPAFPANAREKPMVFQLLQPNSEKGSFSSFFNRSGQPVTPLPKEPICSCVKSDFFAWRGGTPQKVYSSLSGVV